MKGLSPQTTSRPCVSTLQTNLLGGRQTHTRLVRTASTARDGRIWGGLCHNRAFGNVQQIFEFCSSAMPESLFTTPIGGLLFAIPALAWRKTPGAEFDPDSERWPNGRCGLVGVEGSRDRIRILSALPVGEAGSTTGSWIDCGRRGTRVGIADIQDVANRCPHEREDRCVVPRTG